MQKWFYLVHKYIECSIKVKEKGDFDMSVYGVGTLGVFKDGSKPRTKDGHGKNTREYALWSHMLERCYSDKLHEERPTYKECTVCERWLVFANFLEDLPLIENYELWKNNPNTGVSLDKDSKVQGNKIYSLETCKFLSRSNNAKESVRRNGSPTSPKKVMAISLTETKVLVFQSMTQADKLGFQHSNISACCNGKLKSHKGYKWKCI